MQGRTIILAAGTVAIAGVLLIFLWLLRPFSQMPVRYTVRGIDVSHHQEVIEWARVAKTHLRFAYLKASEGGDWRDESFGANLQGARDAGLAAGAYHFFTFCSPGGAQARNFLSSVEPDATDLPPAVDLEYVGNCAARPAREKFARELRAFLHITEARYHTAPVLYTTRTFFDAYLTADEFARYPLWIRDLTGVAEMPDKRTVLLRQFSEDGSIPGIRKRVDEDLYMGSKEDFAALLRANKHSFSN